MQSNDTSDFVPDTSDFTPDTSDFTPDAAPAQISTPVAAPKAGFLSTLGSDLMGMLTPSATSPYGGMDLGAKQAVAQQAADQNQSQKQAGYSAFYRTVAPMAQAAGLNVPGMEQDAAAGNEAGVYGHAFAPLAAYGAVRGTAAIADALPSRARAGANFIKADAVAGGQPIDPAGPMDAAKQVQRLIKAGGRNVPVVSKFLTRMKDQTTTPMTYSEGRDFYSNASSLSANDRNNLNPKMQRAVGQFAQALGSSIQDTANQAGVGPEHASAMREYRQASQLSSAVKGGVALGATAVGGNYALHRILQMLSGGR